ncbi:MAG TPA: hypothetical protein VKE92_15070 [Anaerolineales bacterium]|nr:hypothetical protein [Anaerolineales bacterium]
MPIDWGLEPWRLALINTLPQVVLIVVVVLEFMEVESNRNPTKTNDSID